MAWCLNTGIPECIHPVPTRSRPASGIPSQLPCSLTLPIRMRPRRAGDTPSIPRHRRCMDRLRVRVSSSRASGVRHRSPMLIPCSHRPCSPVTRPAIPLPRIRLRPVRLPCIRLHPRCRPDDDSSPILRRAERRLCLQFVVSCVREMPRCEATRSGAFPFFRAAHGHIPRGRPGQAEGDQPMTRLNVVENTNAF